MAAFFFSTSRLFTALKKYTTQTYMFLFVQIALAQHVLRHWLTGHA